MNIRENEAFGTTVVISEGESLDAIPASHRDILPPEVARLFPDIREWLRETASRCRFENMRRWLAFMAAEGRCKLLLEEGFMMDRITRAGVFLWSDQVRCALITPPTDPLPAQDAEAFSHYYGLINVLDWTDFGWSGGARGAGQHIPLADYWTGDLAADVDPHSLRVWGSSDSGDMLVHATDGRAGWLSHENSRIHWLGTVQDAINWIFGELMANRTPAYNYEWA